MYPKHVQSCEKRKLPTEFNQNIDLLEYRPEQVLRNSPHLDIVPIRRRRNLRITTVTNNFVAILYLIVQLKKVRPKFAKLINIALIF